jgi:CheY-like chemotaxis protein
VVDSSVVGCKLLVAKLKSVGYEVGYTTDGDMMMEKAFTRPRLYDLLLVDMTMSVVDDISIVELMAQ